MSILHSIRSHRLALGGILLLTVWLYAPGLGFGFIWDDPIWFGRVVERPFLDLIRPMSDFQFYRPGTMLYNRLFAGPDGVFPAPLMHAAQIGWHLLNVALVYAIARRLGAARGTAVAAAALMAFYPFAHQSVAWAAPQQPMAAALQGGAWLTFLTACRRKRNRWRMAGLSLFLFLLALAVQESSVALAGLPLLLAWATGNEKREIRIASHFSLLISHFSFRLALLYPLAAAGFGLVWLQAPRRAGITSFAPELEVLLYLLQGIVYPWAGRPAGYDPDFVVNPTLFLWGSGLTVALLLLLARRGGYGRLAIVGLAWAMMGVAPALAGLSFSYVSLGARLLYYAGPGAGLLWAGALTAAWPQPTSLEPNAKTQKQKESKEKSVSIRVNPWPKSPTRVAGFLLLIFIAAQSVRMVWSFQQLYAVGTAHLAEMAATPPEAGQLYVNFPDRYAPKRPFFPVGYWGVTLAPVVVELGDFPAMTTGEWRQTHSRAMPWLDAEARQDGPYLVDMRGVITPPEELYQLGHDVESVYLSRYTAGGSFALQRAGGLRPAADNVAGCQAIFAQTVCLKTAAVNHQQDQLTVTLTWLSLAPADAHDAVFIHLGSPGQPPLAQADGDAWLGMLPLAAWQPGDQVTDVRYLPASDREHVLAVGVYNRLTGQRLPAYTLGGEPLPGDAWALQIP